ncbi:hypothetical protein [Bradyrhizobium cenepequi]
MSGLGLPFDRELDERESTILTTALLLGCDLRMTDSGMVTFNLETDPNKPWHGTRSQPYLSKITACDNFLSNIGVYVNPHGVVYLPPNLKV